MTLLELAVLVLAVARVARLVTADTITEPLRQRILERWPGPLTQFTGDAAVFDHVEAEDATTRHGKALFREGDGWYAERPSLIGYLIECHWCVGVWVSVSLVVAFVLWPDVVWWPLVALAVAHAAGIVGQIDP